MKYLGKNNWVWAFRPSQFLLHKDAVLAAFTDQIAARGLGLEPASPAATASD